MGPCTPINSQRLGFSYFYVKRKVLEDGATTVPLDLVLKPAKRTNWTKVFQNNVPPSNAVYRVCVWVDRELHKDELIA